MSVKTYYDVAPRYTAGSPALVSNAQARQLAVWELEGHQRALGGAYGPDEQTRATKLGLAGIVERKVEKGRHWEVFDLITGESFVRPFCVKVKGREFRRRERVTITYWAHTEAMLGLGFGPALTYTGLIHDLRPGTLVMDNGVDVPVKSILSIQEVF